MQTHTKAIVRSQFKMWTIITEDQIVIFCNVKQSEKFPDPIPNHVENLRPAP